MKRFTRALVSTICASAVLMGGITVFADEKDKTPSGVSYGEIGTTIEGWASENPTDYVSFVTAVFDKDEMLYEGAFGYVDRENGIEADLDSVYEWGSVSKLTIWVSVMQLYEQGRLDLNADVRTYLPDGFLQNLKYDEPVTMLNLMNHNAGWGEGTWALQVENSSEVPSLGDALRASEPPQIYRPCEVSSYSNWGAALAGYIVDCITGQSFADYVHENIFEPLGMEHTSILPDHSDNPWVQEKRKELVAYATLDGSTWDSQGNQLVYITIYPAGAVTGTISDMAKFAQSFVSDDCPLFEKKETRDLMLSPSAYFGNTDIATCFHGLWPEEYENASTLGHTGGTNACSSELIFDKETGLGAVYMTAGGFNVISDLIFGKTATPDLSAYSAPITDPGNAAGIYIGTRSIRHGIFKFFSLLSIFPAVYSGDNTYDIAGMATVTQVSDEVLIFTQNDQSYPCYTYTLSNGTRIFSLGSQSFAKDNTVIPSIFLLAAFAIMTVVGALLLVYKLLGVVFKSFKYYSGSLFIGLSQIFRIMVVVPPVMLLNTYTVQYGLTRSQGYLIFGVNAVSIVVFAVTLVSSFRYLISKDSDAWPKARYVMSIIGNIISIAMLLLLEMLNIWGI